MMKFLDSQFSCFHSWERCGPVNKLFVLVFSLLVSQMAHTAIRIGNNGEGVLRDQKVYLLDLVESGNYKTPFMGASSLQAENFPRSTGTLEKYFPAELPLL